MKTPQFSRSTLTIALCLALGLTGLFAVTRASNAQAPKPAAAPKASMTVTTGKPSQATLPMRLSANGNIAAWQDASVGSEASGLRLAEVLVNVGDFVKRGQVLADFILRNPHWVAGKRVVDFGCGSGGRRDRRIRGARVRRAGQRDRHPVDDGGMRGGDPGPL